MNTYKRFTILFASLLLVLSLSFVSPHQVTLAAGCYKKGHATFSTNWKSPEFNFPGGYLKGDVKVYASKPNTKWTIELYKTNGSWAADIGDQKAQTKPKSVAIQFWTGKSFKIPKGKYYLKFTNQLSSYGHSVTHVTSYCVHS